MPANKNNAGELSPMLLLDCDDGEPLPTEGMDVEEFRDEDTVRLFMLEWRRRMRRELPDQPTALRHMPRPGGMMGA
jgi:hypothetical protein